MVERDLASRAWRCCVVDYDVIRDMFVRPHLAPWQKVPARAQDELGARQPRCSEAFRRRDDRDTCDAPERVIRGPVE